MSNTPFERRLRVSNSSISIVAFDPDTVTVSTSVKSKAIVTVTSSTVLLGLQAAPIQFTYDGMLISIVASLVNASTAALVFDVQQCSEVSFNSPTQVWTSLLTTPCTIAAGSLSASASIINSSISKGIYVRVMVTSTIQDATGLVVETTVGVS